MLRILAALALLSLAACGADNKWADEAALMNARYSAPPPRSITLFTVVKNRTGEGAHSALLVNGSEQVLFDPAGSMEIKSVPERHDVLHGMTPAMVNAFIDYHARDTHHVVEQKIYVSAAVAEQILNAVKANGAVPKAHCANSISKILTQVAGFNPIRVTYFPNQLSKAFATLPAVSTRTIYESNADHSHGIQFLEPEDFAALQAKRAAAAQ